MCKTNNRQRMTTADKGHVLHWLDFGKTPEEVSVLTHYAVWRIKILWDALGDDEYKRTLKEIYYESRERSKQDEVTQFIQQDQHKSTVGDKFGRSKEVSDVQVTGRVPRVSTGGRQVNGDRVRRYKGVRPAGSGQLVDSMRKHKDYRGE